MHHVLVQPNGRLAVWAANVDLLRAWNLTDDETVQWFVEHGRYPEADERRAAQWAVARARAGVTPRHLPSYTEAAAITRARSPHAPPVELVVTFDPPLEGRVAG